MIIDGNLIIADVGKTFRRIGTNEILGNELTLGYSYYIEGVLQDPPHLDVPEDFEEIDEPEPVEEEDIRAEEALEIITGKNYEAE